ncbi:alpha/beta hydrolase [Oceanicaulis sp. LC35]|uniref:alpha/beta hydrolase n=1 Tax=Oceanicaulis sp. LC35 TaxID=3349635 RepID=UPI003F847507
MKSVWIAAILALGIAQTALAQAPAPVSQNPIITGESFVLDAPSLGDEREVNIWVPPFLDELEQPINVVYLIDGGLEQDFQHMAGLAQLGALSWQYEPFMLVGVQTKNRLFELTRPADDPRYQTQFEEQGGSEAFLAFLTEEVIPFVEARYPASDRRTLIGESLAGLFVTDTFLHAPASFTDYIAVSPSLWWDDQAAGKAASTLLTAQDDAPRRLYLTMANEGGTMQNGLDQLVYALRQNAPQTLDWFYVDRSATETHSTILHPAALDAFRTLFALPPYDYGETPWYLIEGGEPSAEDDSEG